MKGVSWIAAISLRVGQRPDDLHEIDNRAWPAVGDNQRQSVRFGGADVQEVDVLPVDLGGELRVGVELGLPGAPVVTVSPVLDEFLHPLQAHAVVRPGAGDLVGPAGALEPLLQVV